MTTTSTTAANVAETIYQQIGGRRFAVMVGMKQRSYGTNAEGNDYTTIKIGSGAKCKGKTVNNVRITLRADDTYTVEFIHATVRNVVTRNVIEGVYADMLQEVFTANTGMYTNL